jgi:hypothetical protein
MTLAELVEHPERVADVPAAEIPVLLTRLATITAALAARMTVNDFAKHAERSEPDELLTLDQAAARLKTSTDFLRRSPAMKPLRVRLAREIRISSRAIERYIRQAAGRE